jgi:hypothetical protein
MASIVMNSIVPLTPEEGARLLEGLKARVRAKGLVEVPKWSRWGQEHRTEGGSQDGEVVEMIVE